MRLRLRVLAAMVASAAMISVLSISAAGAAVDTPHLDYYGGRVISNVKIDVVVWRSWSYPSTVPLTGRRSVQSFASGVVASRYVDWLSEYNTLAQRIGRGTLEGVFTVDPPTSADGNVVSDASIRRALSSLIAAGRLPRPSVNRLLVVFFRRGQIITRPGADSVRTFCAYHDTMSYSSRPVAYAVIPYELDNAGCRATTSSFNSLTTVVSHEIIEGITDPGVGLGRVAWYDRSNGEIADICARTIPGYVTGSDGVRYMVQREWSNQRRSCVLL
jgi:hypothetical protein